MHSVIPLRAVRSVVARLAVAASLAVTVLVAVPAIAGATSVTLYVSASGSDTSNTCTVSSSPCATVSHALAEGASGDVVDVTGYVLDDITVDYSVTVQQWSGKSGANLEPSGENSMFTVDSGATLTLDDVDVVDATADAAGGALYVDAGGIANLNGDTFTDDDAINGGAIYNDGNTTLSDSVVSGGDADGFGGGIENAATLTVTDSVISDNQSYDSGGGIYGTESSTTTVSDSTLAYNDDTGSGAGGGGIANVGAATLQDDTLYGNSSTGSGAVGGGVLDVDDATSLVIEASTVMDNDAPTNNGGGVYLQPSTSADFFATAVAGNNGANCAGDGTFHSAGYNLTTTSSATSCGFTSTSDVATNNPEFGSLNANGGPTQTVLPNYGSPAIGAIPSGTSYDSFSACPGTDQRGVPRPQPTGGSDCTIGSTEVAPGTVPSFTSVDGANFPVNTDDGFLVTTNGFPSAAVTETGSLPSGVTLSTTGQLSGTPTTTGTYPITLTATNGYGTATQDFTLVVTKAAAITSPATAAFTAGTHETFNVTSIGYPAPTYSLIGAPTWLSINATTGVLSGDAPTKAAGVTAIAIVAANSTSEAVQLFSLTVHTKPQFGAGTHVTLTAGVPALVTVTASGYPAPTISLKSALPPGLSFSAKAASGTATIKGTPSLGDARKSYLVKLQANNGVNPTAKETLTIAVKS